MSARGRNHRVNAEPQVTLVLQRTCRGRAPVALAVLLGSAGFPPNWESFFPKGACFSGSRKSVKAQTLINFTVRFTDSYVTGKPRCSTSSR